MPTFLIVLIIIAIVVPVWYGIKLYFESKKNSNQETSNSPIKKAIGSLLFAFLAMVGLGPLLVDLGAQALNQSLGWTLQPSSTDQLLGFAAFGIFGITLSILIYYYYNNRHKLYLQEQVLSPTNSAKNSINNSQIRTESFHLGDNTMINNHGKIDKQVNLDTNYGKISL